MPNTSAAKGARGAGRGRKEHLARAERGDKLTVLLDELRTAKTPSWPADFCRRARISKRTLTRFPEIAAQVRDYGWATARGKMRLPSPRKRDASDPARPTRAGSTGRGTASAVPRAAQLRVAKLRAELAAAKRALSAERERARGLESEVASRERLIEELVARVVTPRNGVAEQVEDVLRILRQ